MMVVRALRREGTPARGAAWPPSRLQTVARLGATLYVAAAFGTTALAGTSFIGSFSGGGHAGGADCSLDSSIGVIGGSATTGPVSVVTGAPLPVTAKTLVVAVAPPAIPEGSSAQLSGVAMLDDNTVNVLNGGDIGWGAVTYPFASVNADGVLTATNVYANTNGVVTAVYLGACTSVCVVVMDTNPDNYGLYAQDEVPDKWQVRYFGTNNPLGVASAMNLTGHNNLYSYTADLDPSNPESVFAVASISNQPLSRLIFFRTTSTGRVYRLSYATNLVSAVWTNLPDTTWTPGAAGQMSLCDTNATEVRFYRVQVQVP